MFELYVFDVTKIKDNDITDGSWVRAMVTALKNAEKQRFRALESQKRDRGP